MLGQISNNFIKGSVIFKNNYNIYLHLDYKGCQREKNSTYLYIYIYIDIDIYSVCTLHTCLHTHIHMYLLILSYLSNIYDKSLHLYNIKLKVLLHLIIYLIQWGKEAPSFKLTSRQKFILGMGIQIFEHIFYLASHFLL